MIEVIRKSSPENFEAECECHSIVRFDETDIKYDIYAGDFIICPECHRLIYKYLRKKLKIDC